MGLHGGENNVDKITIVENDGNSKGEEKDGVFFKSVELPDNQRAFAYYRHNQGDELYFNISKFSKNNDKSISKTDILSSATDKSFWFSCYVTYNDIHKINDNRIAVVAVSTNLQNHNGLVLLLYDLYNNYQNLKRRW